jgi:multisubunit Na+/H+ antiporter MnhE subunit
MICSTRNLVAVAARVAALFVVWLAIDDNVSEPELLTGVVVALLATALTLVVGRLRTVHARFTLSMFRYCYRPLALLFADSLRVSWALIGQLLLRRPVTGRFRAVRYGATSAKRETDVARRILSEWGASLAPNRYAIGVDTEGGVLIVHELVETEGALDPLELG